MRVSGEIDGGIVRLQWEAARHAVRIKFDVEFVYLGHSEEQ